MLIKLLRQIHVGEAEGLPVFYRKDEIIEVDETFIKNWDYENQSIPLYEIVNIKSEVKPKINENKSIKKTTDSN